MAIAPIPPAPALCPDSGPPIHRRTTESFQKLVRFEQDPRIVSRLLSQFLGTDVPAGRNLVLGGLRAALLWSCLPDYLAERGWTVAGSIGFEDSSYDDLASVRFESLRLGPELWLELPLNLQVFLERGDERAAIGFDTVQSMSPERQVLVGIHGTVSGPALLEEWLQHAREHNPLRGRKLRADWKLIEPRARPEDSRAFLDPSIRQRLEMAVRRFLSPATARLGLRQRGGLILSGPPGTGKTSLCRELVEQVACTVIWTCPADVPNGAAAHEVFEVARWLAPTIVVLEDLDLMAEGRDLPRRAAPLGQLMNELDGAAGDHAVFALGTTNRYEAIEKACGRPGRFDQVLTLNPPDAALRLELLAHRMRRCRASAEDLLWTASRLDGATGAEIEEVANAAIAAALLDGQEEAETPVVGQHHLEAAFRQTQRDPDRRAVGFGAAEGTDV